MHRKQLAEIGSADARFIVASGLLVRDGAVLLVENVWRTATDWTLPGGRVEPGESLSEALMREFLEETGLRIERIGALLSVTHSLQGSLAEEALLLLFRIEAVGGELKPGDDEFVRSARFVPVAEIEALVRNPASRIPLLDALRLPKADIGYYEFVRGERIV